MQTKQLPHGDRGQALLFSPCHLEFFVREEVVRRRNRRRRLPMFARKQLLSSRFVSR